MYLGAKNKTVKRVVIGRGTIMNPTTSKAGKTRQMLIFSHTGPSIVMVPSDLSIPVVTSHDGAHAGRDVNGLVENTVHKRRQALPRR